ncbi:MAG TPA: class II aldolase/adducin family protein [Solirubrobacteraceae bacterium]|jgi:ribulose-5-phosphate 4-epimerase/fuculose-1-phosphate aldolase|nr:class II aldolase/adducin family protein [Solirubrobacteraceae bacterium]
MTAAAPETQKSQVVDGCRVLGAQDVGDPVWGHVSLRDADGRGAWMKAGPLGFDEVTTDDVVLIDFDGSIVAGNHRVPLEYPLHTEILRARTDVSSVVHTHPPYSIALGATGRNLEVFSNAAGPFATGVPRYTRPVGLIDTAELGTELAECLGAARAALMAGHGVVSVGSSVAAAVTTALLLERACQLHLAVTAAGGLDPALTEPGDRYRHTASEQYLLRTWDYLLRRVSGD